MPGVVNIEHGQPIDGPAMSGDNLLLLLVHGRFDFVLEYASIAHALRSRQSSGEPLISLPVSESRELLSVGVYCTRNPWGQQLALQLYDAIRQAFHDPIGGLTLHANAAGGDLPGLRR